MREGVALIALRQVNRLRLHTYLEARPKIVSGALQFIAIARCECQVDTLARQFLRNRKADTLARAGDGGRFSSQMQFH